MPEEQNISRENAERADEQSSADFVKDASTTASDSGASSRCPKTKLKKLWGYGKAVLDYIDEEVPEPPEKADRPKSSLRKKWDAFNAFLDSLALPAENSVASVSAEEKTCGRRCFLNKTGVFCWASVFFASILVFLFAATMLATYTSMDYIKTHTGTFYPDREIMKYLNEEHISLEAAADRVPERADNISADLFDAKSLEVIKPIRIYSDKYGVYLVTRDSWYSGEHGIFIARDAENMREDFNWGLIAGRVFTYAIVD